MVRSCRASESDSCLLLLVQIQTPNKEVIITNDGATILDKLELAHPAAKMVILTLHCLLVPSVHFAFSILLAVRGALEGPRC